MRDRVRPNWFVSALSCSVVVGSLGSGLRADVAPSQVLVVYNGQDPEAGALLTHYLSAHPSIPAANVFDLNDASLVGVANVTHTDYLTKIAGPIQAYLTGGFGPTPESIIVICLIRGIPHRVYDNDAGDPDIGDSPSPAATEFATNGDATYASVDAELVLLFQDLYGSEANGFMDSLADNVIASPYYGSAAAIDSFSRDKIQAQKNFTAVSGPLWVSSGGGPTLLTAGDIYLVCRIDGATPADAMAVVDRARNLVVNRNHVSFHFDEHASTEFDEQDYENARDLLQDGGWQVDYDDTSNFVSSSETTSTIIGFASFGENHVDKPPLPKGTYIQGYSFAPGAIFNTVESFNARDLNGLGNHPSIVQEQVVDFLAEGGTFAVGFVWEPFSFSIPDNEFLFVNFFVNRMTFAEAAYTSMPFLSWQIVAIGDPLSKVQQVIVCDFDQDSDCDGTDFLTFSNCFNGSVNPPSAICADPQADIDLDGDVDGTDFLTFSNCFNGALNLPTCF